MAAELTLSSANTMLITYEEVDSSKNLENRWIQLKEDRSRKNFDS